MIYFFVVLSHQKQRELEAAQEAREAAEKEAEEELKREKEGYDGGPRVPKKSRFVSSLYKWQLVVLRESYNIYTDWDSHTIQN